MDDTKCLLELEPSESQCCLYTFSYVLMIFMSAVVVTH